MNTITRLALLVGLIVATSLADIKVGKEYPFGAQNSYQSQFRWIDSSRALSLQFSGGRIDFSKDGGMSWEDLRSKLEGSTVSGYQPGFLYPNNIDKNKIYIRGNGDKCWRSFDKGDNWEAFTPQPPLLYRNLLWHPQQPEWAIAGVFTSYTDREGKIDLYVTQDFGRNWKLVVPNVTRDTYTWGDAGQGSVPVSRIYFASREATAAQYIDFFETDDWGANLVVLQSKTRGFLFLNKQLFVAIYVPDQKETILKVSPDIGYKYKRFYDTRFPFGKTLDYNGYSVLDDSTGAVFLGVNHEDLYAHWGTLYLSDSLGSSYSLSLNHISQVFGSYDFTKVNGLDGIYLANTVADWEDKETPNDYNNLQQTYITFNNGGEWKPLTRPYYDSKNETIVCAGNCQLHLHGFTSYFDTEGYGPFYSSANTLGVIIANGNVGEYLVHDRADIATYLSRDAGLTWIEIMKGPSIYEFGDQGGILVLAPTGVSTTEIYYSLDQGLTPLKSFKFTNSPVDIANIITDPSGKGSKFIILGERQGSAMIIGVDFTQVFASVCTEKDYEEWTPKDGKTDVNGKNCLLGRDVTYRRRKQASYCQNMPNYQTIVRVETCSCTDDDWECDYGYERGTDGKCVQVFQVEYPPANCVEGAEYYKTKGYRKVASNTCQGGVQHAVDGPYKCPKNNEKLNLRSNKGWIAAVVVIPFVFILLGGAFFAMRSEKLREKVPILKALHDWRVGYFNMNNGPQNDILDDEELAFTNMDEDAEEFVNDHPPSDKQQGIHDVGLLQSQPNIGDNSSHEDPFDPRK